MAGQNTVEQRLETAMRALPPKPGAEALIPEIVIGLTVVRHMGWQNDNRRNWGRTVSNKTAAKELRDMAKTIATLVQQYRGLHKNALDALNSRPLSRPDRHIALAEDILREVYSSAHAAAGELEQAPQTEAEKGRARKHGSAWTADAAYYAYESLTGRPPTIIVDPLTAKASGPFMTFLAAVFEALQIRASVESAARAAIAQGQLKAKKA